MVPRLLRAQEASSDDKWCTDVAFYLVVLIDLTGKMKRGAGVTHYLVLQAIWRIHQEKMYVH